MRKTLSSLAALAALGLSAQSFTRPARETVVPPRPEGYDGSRQTRRAMKRAAAKSAIRRAAGARR